MLPLKIRTQVLFWLCGLTAIAYLQRNLGVAETTLRDAGHFSLEQMGAIQSSFFWSYALFQVPAGWLCRRWGPRAGMTVFGLTFSLALALTGVSLNLEVLCAIRILSGMGQAAALPCIADVISTWFPETIRGRATACVSAFMQVGAVLNSLVTGPLLEQFSLSNYFLILGAPGIVWAIGFYWWYRDRPEDFRSLTDLERSELPQRRDVGSQVSDFQWTAMLTSPVMWLINGQQFCRAAGYIVFGTWFATYMQKARNYNVNESGVATACAFAGVLAGTLLGGTLSDLILLRTGRLRLARQGVAICSLLMCSLCIGGFLWLDGTGATVNLMAMTLLTLGTFFSGVAGPSGYAVTISMAGRHVPTVFAVMNMAGNIGAASMPLLIPVLLGPGGDQWNRIFIVTSLLYLTAAVFWMLLDPSQTVFGARRESPDNSRQADPPLPPDARPPTDARAPADD